MDQDVAAIEQVKYAYFRLLDLKRFVELGELLTEDATAAYEDGRRSFAGRAAIVAFLTEALGDPGIVSAHHGHHPEITVDGDRATGVWYLTDRVIVPAFDVEIGGTAFYNDEYVRRDGRWYISHTGYERVFEERRRHTTGELLSLRTRFGDD
ncbi:MAG TPA: nuclear transport factor 2 family protein [Acidimicrobiales bacterium]|nr:nuclear transport factor 2 family protein [Acidimicrobiales bacterium]